MKINLRGHFLGLTRKEKHKMYVNEKELEIYQDTVLLALGTVWTQRIQCNLKIKPMSFKGHTLRS